jgi:hypothetical protein
VSPHVLEVADPQGRTLFAYDAATGRCTVGVPAGDLVLDVPNGRFAVRAAEGIALAAPTFTLESPVARFVLGRLETVANRVVEHAQNVYRRVDELAELRAGRVRTICAGLLDLRGRTAQLRADEIARVDGARVELG